MIFAYDYNMFHVNNSKLNKHGLSTMLENKKLCQNACWNCLFRILGFTQV